MHVHNEYPANEFQDIPLYSSSALVRRQNPHLNRSAHTSSRAHCTTRTLQVSTSSSSDTQHRWQKDGTRGPRRRFDKPDPLSYAL